MPTKKRKEREQQGDAIRRALENPPEHVRQRMENPSEASDRLAEALPVKLYNGGIFHVDDEGDICQITQDRELGANANRNEEKAERAESLREKYRDIWGKRGAAGIIARKEGLNQKTIRRYFRDFPRN
ncbi:hypothetical protein JCM17960_16740 [Magnetospira thiophila]